jgi:hypothetical protein
MSRTLAMLREESRLYRQAAAEEPTPEIRYRLVNHAFALVQLAERIEREGLAKAPTRRQTAP